MEITKTLEKAREKNDFEVSYEKFKNRLRKN